MKKIWLDRKVYYLEIGVGCGGKTGARYMLRKLVKGKSIEVTWDELQILRKKQRLLYQY